LLYEEAFDVLALEPGATAAEIKEAYRDLVKVWHPDRFGHDPRLRRKAEEKLHEINDAYRVLQSPPKLDVTCEDPVRRRNTGASTASNKDGASSNRAIVGWICGALGIAAVVIAVMIALPHDLPQAPVAPETQQQEPTGAGNHVESSPHKAPRVPMKDASHLNQAEAQFRVRQLSGAEAAQLEADCPREKESRDPISYQKCVQAQLEASAPDMSALSAEDQAGIESACTGTKIREGSAAYNRCLTRMVRLLKESSPQ
jgi:curved DNA-binding protein CbpA